MPSLEIDPLHHKCGIAAVYGRDDAGWVCLEAIHNQQHRGQERGGLVTRDVGGLVQTLFSGTVGRGLFSPGIDRSSPLVKSSLLFPDLCNSPMAMGHVRYPTNGAGDHPQPVSTEYDLVVGHNGTLSDTEKLDTFLERRELVSDGWNDSQKLAIAAGFLHREKIGMRRIVEELMELSVGGVAVTLMNGKEMAGYVGDPGIRPLIAGEYADGGFGIMSESCGFAGHEMKWMKDIPSGSMFLFNEHGYEEISLKPEAKGLIDVFEFVYFADPRSTIWGRNVGDVRKELGRKLAVHFEHEVDIVVPVLETGREYAQGMAEALGLPYVEGLERINSGRSFIEKGEKRSMMVKRKHQANPKLVEGNRIVLVDDSYVRGTTGGHIVAMLREAGALEIHNVSGAPKVLFPDYFGIDITSEEELIANKMNEEGIARSWKAESVTFQRFFDMVAAIGVPPEKLYKGVFDGIYPVRVRDEFGKIIVN